MVRLAHAGPPPLGPRAPASLSRRSGQDHVPEPGAPGRVRLTQRGLRADPEHLLRRGGREQVHGPRDDAGPPGLVARAEAGPVVAVEVLVEQDEVAPVRVFLELAGAAVDRAAALPVAQEDAGQ